MILVHPFSLVLVQLPLTFCKLRLASALGYLKWPRDEDMHVEVLEPNAKANINLYAYISFIGIFFCFPYLAKHSLRGWVVVKMVENIMVHSKVILGVLE